MKIMNGLGVLLLASACMSVHAEDMKALNLSVPPGRLDAALEAFSRQAECELIFRVDEVDALRSEGVQGSLPLEDALTNLLRGTGLTYFIDSSGAIAIVKEDKSKDADRLKASLWSQPEERANGAPSSNEHAVALEEIVVTSRRREESIQQTPVAVSAFSAEELKMRSATDVMDVARQVPNLTMSVGQRSSTGINMTLRGQSSTTPAANFDTPIGIYYDGVYIGGGAAAVTSANMDMERVEIDRGVQGTLSGRNTTGGAIRFFTHEPEDALFAEVTASAGNEGQLKGHLKANVPVSDSLALRFNYLNEQRDSLGRSLATGDGFGGRDRQVGRASMRWNPDDRTTVRFIFEKSKIDEDATSAHPVVDPPNEGIPSDIQDTNSGLASVSKFESDRYTAIIDRELTDNLNVKGTLAYQDDYYIANFDSDGLFTNAVDVRDISQDHNQWSAELQLNGSLFDHVVEWVAGYLYFEESADMGPYVLLPNGLTTVTGADNESSGVFADLTYNVTDAFAVSAGARYTRDRREVYDKSYQVTAAGANCVAFRTEPTTECYVSKNTHFDYVDFNLSASLQVAPGKLMYARVGRGHRSGGFNLRISRASDLTPFPEEEVTEFELGTKLDLFDNKLRLNLAAFYADYKDMQRRIGVVLNGIPTLRTDTAGKATISGVELESTYFVTDHLRLNATLGYTNAEYDEFRTTQVASGDASDNEFANTPELQYSVSGIYDRATSWGRFNARLDYAWQDEVYFTDLNTPLLRQSSYGLVNGRLGLALNQLPLELALFGKNLTDKEYASYGIDAGNFKLIKPGEPRLFGVEVTYRFQ